MYKEILIVDDVKQLTDNLKYILNEKEYNLACIYTSEVLLKKIKENKYDFLILEKTIEGFDGIELCKEVRKISTIPIIMISDNDEEMSKILAFEYGADDYLVKPFNISELKARIMSIFRRMDYKIHKQVKHIFEIDGFTIDFLKRLISIEDKDINLTGKEFDLFYVLSSNPGKTFTREELLDRIWGQNHYSDIRNIDVHIRRIREKLSKNTKEDKCIMTKWGEGYYFNKKNRLTS